MQCACPITYRCLWSAWLHNIFPHYFISGTIFGEKLFKIKFILIFSTTLSETFLILRKIQGGTIITVRRSSCKVPVNSCQTSMKLEFSEQIFEKCSNIKCNKNPYSGSRVVPWKQTHKHTHRQRDWQTDRQVHMTKLIVAFRNFANASKNQLHSCYSTVHCIHYEQDYGYMFRRVSAILTPIPDKYNFL